MAKVLYIKANPKTKDDSITFKISDEFVEEYKKKNKDDEVITIDLYQENINFLTNEDLINMHLGKDSVVKKYAMDFKEADKYIFAAPLWNLSIPAILKAYIDYVCYAGVSFKYTENGPIGLLENKKAIYIVSRGGIYSGDKANFDFASQYIYGILGFMGIKDITTISCENTGVLMGEDLTEEINIAIEKAKKQAEYF